MLSAVADMCAHCKSDSIVRNSQHQQILQALSYPIYREADSHTDAFPAAAGQICCGLDFRGGVKNLI